MEKRKGLKGGKMKNMYKRERKEYGMQKNSEFKKRQNRKKEKR